MSGRRGSEGERSFDIEGLLSAVREQWITAVVFFFAVLFAAAIGTALTERRYRAVALVQLLPRAGSEMETTAVVNQDDAGYAESRDRARTRIQIMMSRRVREEVVARYRSRGGTDLPEGDAGAEKLLRSMEVAPREDTELVEVAVLHPNPVSAARLANLVTEVYAEANLDSRTDAARETRVWLEGKSGGYREELQAASARAMAYKEAHGVSDIDEAVSGVSARLTALQTAAGTSQTERVLLESRYSEHRRLLADKEYAVLAGMFDDASLDTMARQRAEVVTESADVLSRYGAAHPEHQQAVERIKLIDRLIHEEVRRNVEGEASRLEALRQEERRLAEEIEKVKVELLATQKLQGEYMLLKREEERARELVDSLGARGAEVELQASTRLNDMRVVDVATPPTRPAEPNVLLNLAMGMVIGAAGGVGLALVRQRIAGTILASRDLERSLDTTLLGTLPSLPKNVPARERDLYAFDRPRSFPAEAFRVVRAVLQTYPAAGPCRRLLVTSCLEGEGKSLTAIGVAGAFAQLGQRVLLVDGDLRLPRLHTVFGVERSPGLTDALVNLENVAAYAVPTQVPRLDLLPCGTQVEYPNEFVSSPELAGIVDELSNHYDVILFDTPPVGLVSDALSLAACTDGLILVVRRGRASRRVVQQVLLQLRQSGVRVLGSLLNDVPRRPGDAGYGSRYYNDTARVVRQPKG